MIVDLLAVTPGKRAAGFVVVMELIDMGRVGENVISVGVVGRPMLRIRGEVDVCVGIGMPSVSCRK